MFFLNDGGKDTRVTSQRFVAEKLGPLYTKMHDTKSHKYRRFVEQLYVKCLELQTENERYVYRLTKMKKMIKHRNKDVAILKSRLDRYNDGWRHVPMCAPHRTRKTELKRGPKPKPKNSEPKVRSSGNNGRKPKNSDKTTKQQLQSQ